MFFFKWLRVALAVIFFAAISVLFLDFNQTVPRILHWVAHLQITPAILICDFGTDFNIFEFFEIFETLFQTGTGILLFWIILTLLFGRIYCSVMCPFGILQDIFSRIAKLLRGKRFRFKFRFEMKKTRYGLLAIFVIGLIFFPVIVSVFDPYSHFGRVMMWIFRPFYLIGNDILAKIAPDTFYYVSNYINIPSFLLALSILLLTGILSAFFGRRYCNTICPVGTMLGLISRFSRYKIRLKAGCISCGLCERSCKGECIDSKKKTVDSSRCVSCFNCLSTCKRQSLVYSTPLPHFSVTPEEPEPLSPEPEPLPQPHAAFVPVTVSVQTTVSQTVIPQTETPRTKNPRRQFLQWSVFSIFLPSVGGSVVASNSLPDPSLPTGVSRLSYKKTTPILPPGAKEQKRFRKKCTACHLCVSKCPAQILTPSTFELGLAGFLQPVVQFDRGFCNYDCTICTEVCPSRALTMIESVEEKHLLQIGQVIFVKENCVVETQGSNCGACAEHCPTGAVHMVPYGDSSKSLTIPEVEVELCVGCGACEHVCPVRPFRAIYIDGLEKHRNAKPAYDPNEKQQEVKVDDFGF
ncbi:MAG: 4Fe-4S dicluster domain-containing protein [Planctomycetaceae bacterium]|jgi:ferredoxin|nr:4Fe-4S dicluster domain-containing protein [Planctomycetaceae bacterium]